MHMAILMVVGTKIGVGRAHSTVPPKATPSEPSNKPGPSVPFRWGGISCDVMGKLGSMIYVCTESAG